MAKVVIVGALGVVGRAAMERFAGRPGLRVVGLARRSPDFAASATWVSTTCATPQPPCARWRRIATPRTWSMRR